MESRRSLSSLTNRILPTPDEREQVRQFLETRLRQELNGTLPRIFCVSAREGLEAKREHDQDRLHASGVLDFENALIEFLTTEKMTELLLLVCDRLLNILRTQPQTEQLKALGARASGDPKPDSRRPSQS